MPSEVVREGLRLLQQREAEDRAKIEGLRGAFHEAIASLDRGEGVTPDSAEDIDTFVSEAVAEARAFCSTPRA